MQRSEFVLAVLSLGGGVSFTPVQVQKLFFLLDQAPSWVGPHFHFQPYDYGPYDGAVYEELRDLSERDLVTRTNPWGPTIYRATYAGVVAGQRHTQQLPEAYRQYAQECVDFVQKLSFVELVSAIFKAYPDMATRAVFSPCGHRRVSGSFVS